MPRKLPTPCLVPGCAALGHGGRCAEHAIQRDREREHRYDAGRGSAASRGYDATWRRLRLMHLRGEPLCRECGAPATDVDHILPLARGGTSEAGNLQSLCHACHASKTNREDGGGWRNRTGTVPQVTVVCGPPGSGKSRYVSQHKGWNDIVFDYDAVMAALTGLPWYERPADAHLFVMAAREAVIGQLTQPSAIVRGWVIASAPRRHQREELRQRLSAQVIVLAEPEEVCIGRLVGDRRRHEHIDHWRGIVQEWWRSYEPDPRDTVVAPG